MQPAKNEKVKAVHILKDGERYFEVTIGETAHKVSLQQADLLALQIRAELCKQSIPGLFAFFPDLYLLADDEERNNALRRRTYILKIALCELIHYGARFIHWNAEAGHLCKRDDYVAYRPVGIGLAHPDGWTTPGNANCVFFEVMAVTDLEEGIETLGLSDNWEYTSYTGE